MRNGSIIAAAKPTIVVPSVDHLRFPMHDADSANTVAFSGRIGGSVVSGTRPLAGTTEAFATANIGWFKPVATADNYVLMNSAWRSFFDLSTLKGQGAFIIFLAIKWSANSATDRLFSMNRPIGADGGFEVFFRSDANDNIIVNFRAEDAGAGADAQHTITDYLGDVLPVMAVLDGVGETAKIAINGNWGGAQSVDLSAQAGDWPKYNANYGDPVIGALIASGPSYTTINDGASQDLQMHGLTMLRTTGQPSDTVLARICAQHGRFPRRIPQAARLLS